MNGLCINNSYPDAPLLNDESYSTGDCNNDGHVSVQDLAMITSCYLNHDSCAFETEDVNQDGNADILDVVTLVNIILG